MRSTFREDETKHEYYLKPTCRIQTLLIALLYGDSSFGYLNLGMMMILVEYYLNLCMHLNIYIRQVVHGFLSNNYEFCGN